MCRSHVLPPPYEYVDWYKQVYQVFIVEYLHYLNPYPIQLNTKIKHPPLCCFWMLLLFHWPPVCEVCPNDEVVMFQPWIGTPLDQGSVANCYVAIILIPVPPFSARHPMYSREGYLLMPFPSLPCQTLCLHTGLFSYLVVTCIHPSIPSPISPCTILQLCYIPASPTLFTPVISPTPHCCLHQNLF